VGGGVKIKNKSNVLTWYHKNPETFHCERANGAIIEFHSVDGIDGTPHGVGAAVAAERYPRPLSGLLATVALDIAASSSGVSPSPHAARAAGDIHT
jgi:hypothetical protein